MAVTDENLVSCGLRHGESSSASISNPFHILEQNLVASPIVEIRSPALGVPADSLGGFNGAVIFEEIGDPTLHLSISCKYHIIRYLNAFIRYSSKHDFRSRFETPW